MKILTMTATFGKLEHETITFTPELNIIHAPNEWGKSTWCAFITAMLYGIDTRQRTTDSALADKEHYAPWSGAPMTGRMELLWQDRAITIERWSKGRTPFGQFRAYETQTGAEITELTAANCGQVLLGIERDVFVRSAFLKQTDLPVSDSPALRARLNALVTTGDESGTAEVLAQKLKDLKNRCRHNKTGLLPEAEKERDSLVSKLNQLQDFAMQSDRLRTRLAELEEFLKNLKNHEAALSYQDSFTYTQKLAAAQNTCTLAQQQYDALEAECSALPEEGVLRKNLFAAKQLREEADSLLMQSRMMPAPPVAPTAPEVFCGLSPEQALAKAQEDKAQYDALQEKKTAIPFPLLAVLLLCSAGLWFLPNIWKALALLPLGICAFLFWRSHKTASQQQAAIQQMLSMYPGIAPARWVEIAQDYCRQQEAFSQAAVRYESQKEELDSSLRQANEKAQALTQDKSPAEYEYFVLSALEKRSALSDALRELRRAQDLVQTLESSHKPATPPAFADNFTYSPAETARLLSDTNLQLHQLQHQLGQLQGQMAALGQQQILTRQLQEVNHRIGRLEAYNSALETALSYLADAKTELQKRFAPMISQKAQALMARFTGGRYTRLYLGADFSLNAGTTDEDTLHTALWRSDGTMDQLYLALRLAVAQELAPNAPLILDDAMVRFDDTRLATALEVLKEESQNRQVILFTCQGREQAMIHN